jgi:4-hydroxy-3-methylbut-2-enyl diphosphate reductase
MKVVVANPTGLCFGVRRAVEELENALRDGGRVFALGSPIHNPQEIARLETMGLVVVEDPDTIPEGATVFIRAHGVSPRVFETARKRAGRIVDGTCPFVRNAQERAELLSREGYFVVIVGDEDHPEVQGIRGYVTGEAEVLNDRKEISLPSRRDKIGIVCQTTQKETTLAGVVARVVPQVREIRVFNTICGATVARQDSVRRLAAEVDGIIIIGGRNSANTKKLFEIAQGAGAPVLWVEHAQELDRGWLSDKAIIGVAAGASTPDWLIHQLISMLATERSSRGMDGNGGARESR